MTPELESILKGMKLRVFEVVEGLSDAGPVLRFDFLATDDDGREHICGSSVYLFNTEEYGADPLAFTKFLREVADVTDAYWARAFSTACAEGKQK